MFFTYNMSKKRIYIYCSLIALGGIAFLFSSPKEKNDEFSSRIKIALREVGNQLLLTHQDSTSLVLPIVAIDASKYKLSFQTKLSFEPGTLVSIVEDTFLKSNFPDYYRVEVLQCSDKEVAYSYEINAENENTIIACVGRILPEQCYTIVFTFTKRIPPFFNRQSILYYLLGCIVVIILDYLYSKRKQHLHKNDISYNRIGSFEFYPEQSKLVKAAVEINLSKKECELLALFVTRPNEVIKRDELTKKVWEDNGVFVGRSLDTYISKLRKKLKDDDRIKLTNIHGVGYKLEINE